MTPVNNGLPLRTHEVWIYRVLIAVDEFFNVLLFNGVPYQTISQHSALAARDGKWWGRTLCRFLGWFKANHCANQLKGTDT
jgi:hypothetical protein